MFIIILGNVRDGLDFIGPFAIYDETLAYAEYHYHRGDWIITSLTEPNPK